MAKYEILHIGVINGIAEEKILLGKSFPEMEEKKPLSIYRSNGEQTAVITALDEGRLKIEPNINISVDFGQYSKFEGSAFICSSKDGTQNLFWCGSLQATGDISLRSIDTGEICVIRKKTSSAPAQNSAQKKRYFSLQA